MIRLLPAACGLAALCAAPLLGTPALAQTAGPDAPTASSVILAQSGADSYGWRGRNWRDDSRDEDQRGNRGSDDSWRSGSGRAGMMQEMMAGRGMGGRGLHIRLRRGDAGIDLQCPASSDYSSCISAASQLIDKLESKASSTGTGSSSGGSNQPPTMSTPSAPTNR